jgi:hypothetical protein
LFLRNDMDRLPFTLRDFCRTSWVSDAARDRWHPVFEQIRGLWQRLELATVVAGSRPVGLISIRSDELHGYEAEAKRHSLDLRPLSSFEPNGYVSDLNCWNTGGAFRVCAVGARRGVNEASEAYHSGSSAVVGRLLGYPPCCVEFFGEVWDRQRWIDTTWPMAARTLSNCPQCSPLVDVVARPENNMLLRWLGIRPVFHLPCSLQCDATCQMANEIKSVARDIGGQPTLALLYEILSWPVQWSALHGIAEIDTPVMRISTRTDATAGKFTVRLNGLGGTVDDAAHGNRFPFKPRLPRNAASTTAAPAVIQAVKLPAGDYRGMKSWYHTDNGFHSRIDMDRAFTPLMSVIASLRPRSVLHLACKNGAVLYELLQLDGSLRVFGVDPDQTKIERAKMLLSDHAPGLWCGELSDSSVLERVGRVDACVLMLGRLLEVPSESAASIVEAITRQSGVLIAYAFDDWLKGRPLAEMAAKLGLVLESIVESNYCAAGIVVSSAASAAAKR